jgi:tetratricopeptide (TPR) repeat protein
LLALDVHHSLLNAVEFTADGDTLLVGAENGRSTWQFWCAPSWAEIEDAERAGGRWPQAEAVVAPPPAPTFSETKRLIEQGYRKQLADARAQSPHEFVRADTILADLADFFMEERRDAEAEPLFRELVDTSRPRRPKDDDALLAVIDGLLRAMVERAETEREVDAGRWKQATRLLQKTLELSGASRARNTWGARALDRLANLQLHAGQSEAARTTRNELQIHLQKLLPATAQIESAQVEIVRLRASNAVCSGRWGDATADLQRAVELEPSWKSFLSLAPVLVQAGDTGAYRELCQRALTTLEGSKSKYAFDVAAKICWLLPQDGVDLSKAHRMAGETPAVVANDAGFLPWTELTQGWSEFRAGHFNEAAASWRSRSRP